MSKFTNNSSATKFIADEYEPVDPIHRTTLMDHILMKGLQTFATAGFIGSSVFAIVRRSPNKLQTITRGTFYTSALGLPFTAGMMAYKVFFELTPDGINDRGYRLERNRGQHLMDEMSFTASIFAFLANPDFLKGNIRDAFNTSVQRSAVGLAVGSLTWFLLFSTVDENSIRKMGIFSAYKDDGDDDE